MCGPTEGKAHPAHGICHGTGTRSHARRGHIHTPAHPTAAGHGAGTRAARGKGGHTHRGHSHIESPTQGTRYTHRVTHTQRTQSHTNRGQVTCTATQDTHTEGTRHRVTHSDTNRRHTVTEDTHSHTHAVPQCHTRTLAHTQRALGTRSQAHPVSHTGHKHSQTFTLSSPQPPPRAPPPAHPDPPPPSPPPSSRRRRRKLFPGGPAARGEPLPSPVSPGLAQLPALTCARCHTGSTGTGPAALRARLRRHGPRAPARADVTGRGRGVAGSAGDAGGNARVKHVGKWGEGWENGDGGAGGSVLAKITSPPSPVVRVGTLMVGSLGFLRGLCPPLLLPPFFFLAVFVTEAKLRNPSKAEIPPLLLSEGGKGRRNTEKNAEL